MARPDLDDYVDVPARIAQFKQQYPDGVLRGYYDLVSLPNAKGDAQTHIIYRAEALRDRSDGEPAVGYASEPVPGLTPYTRGSELMNAETSAWGRALVALGFVSKKIASREEVRNRMVATTLTPDEVDRVAQKLTDLKVSLDDSLARLQVYGVDTYDQLTPEQAAEFVAFFTAKAAA